MKFRKMRQNAPERAVSRQNFQLFLSPRLHTFPHWGGVIGPRVSGTPVPVPCALEFKNIHSDYGTH